MVLNGSVVTYDGAWTVPSLQVTNSTVTVGRTLDGMAYARVEAWDPMGRVRRAA